MCYLEPLPMPTFSNITLSIADVQRFWSKCTKTDKCWVWTASTDKDGYGKMSYKRFGRALTFRASRLAYMLT